MEFNLGWLEVLIIDAAALVTIAGYFFARDNRRQQLIDDRFVRVEDKQNELTATCARREEILSAIDPINHQLTEIRHRLDEVVMHRKKS